MSDSRPRAAQESGDEVAPPGGGIFRRMSPSTSSAFGSVFSPLEGIFAPAARDAREELQRQRIAGARNPSDTDPPAPDGAVRARVVAPGRPGTRYSGSVLLPPDRGGGGGDE